MGSFARAIEKHLANLGAGGALLTSLCCLGFSALVSLLSALGLGFLVDDAILQPVLVVTLAIYLGGLGLGYRRHRRWPVLLAGAVAAAANYAFIFLFFQRALAYLAVAALVGVSLWDLVERRRWLRRGRRGQDRRAVEPTTSGAKHT